MTMRQLRNYAYRTARARGLSIPDSYAVAAAALARLTLGGQMLTYRHIAANDVKAQDVVREEIERKGQR